MRYISYVVINLVLVDLSVGLLVGCFGVENLVLSYIGEKFILIGCLIVDFILECVFIVFLVVFFLERMYVVFWFLCYCIIKICSYIYIICIVWFFFFILVIIFIILYIGIIN